MSMKRYLRSAVCLTLLLALLLCPLGAQAVGETVSLLRLKNDYVRLRSDVGGQGEVVATLREGTNMFYLGRSGSMAYVCTEGGLYGYVYSGYLEKYGEARTSNVYYVKSSSLRVYERPSTSADRIVTLGKNSYMLLVDARGTWGKVRSLNGTIGYVLLSGLQRAKR